jgi:hypothetical protein
VHQDLSDFADWLLAHDVPAEDRAKGLAAL